MSPPRTPALALSRGVELVLRARRRVALGLIVALATLAAGTAVGAGARAATPCATCSWQWTPVSPPTPPDGIAPGPFAVPIGTVGQISFWTPNRGLLITGGTATGATFGSSLVPAGLYAYNGAGWHQLSTVCGGAQGRIAWAGPDEFWTISDQRPAPAVTSATSQPNYTNLSLCHFVDGSVVASYAMPLNSADAYSEMNAAACTGPADCWFGGVDTGGITPGAFQLHWDGTNLTATQEPEDYPVDDMTEYQAQIYESVNVQGGQGFFTPPDPDHPPVLHRIGTAEDGPFTDVFAFGDVPGQGQLPAYNGRVPSALSGFSLSASANAADSINAGAPPTQLWAAATPAGASSVTVLEHDEDGWTQLEPTPSGQTSKTTPSCQSPDQPLTTLTTQGLLSRAGGYTATGAVAGMPGTDEAWLSYFNGSTPEVGLIDGEGCAELETPTTTAAFLQQPGQSSPPGASGPISCPTTDDCWMATSNGWLYHYSDGTRYPTDSDPSFAGVITNRPDDAATPQTFSDVPPVDDSLANQAPPPPPTGTPRRTQTARPKPLLQRVKVTLHNHHRVLEMTFMVTARARVQLVARRHNTIVAKTRLRVYSVGHHTLHLRLNPKRYPTRIKVNAKPVKTS